MLTCSKCNKIFSKPYDLKRHDINCQAYDCGKCKRKFNNKYNGSRHESVCGEPIPKRRKVEPSKNSLIAQAHDEHGVCEYESAFGNRLKSYFIRCEDYHDLDLYLEQARKIMLNIVKHQLEQHGTLKINILVDCCFLNVHEEKYDGSLKTTNTIITSETDLNGVMNKFFIKLRTELEEVQLKNSGWSLHAVEGIRLRINKYNPLRGSTYIPLPVEIKNKKACINVKNSDHRCFVYSILAKFVDKDAQRVGNYKNLLSSYDFSCISFPTPLNEIKKFEKANNISINVYGLDENNQIFILKISDEEKEDHRDLLLLGDDKNDGKHYVFIKSLEKLVSNQITKHENAFLLCKRCLTHFHNNAGTSKETRLEAHKKWCLKNKPVRTLMPEPDSHVKFDHGERTLRIPYVVYADFESILLPIEGPQLNYESSYTKPYQKHEPMSFCVYLKQSDDVLGLHPNLPMEPYLYRGPDAGKHFVQYIKTLAEEVSKMYSLNNPMLPLTKEEEQSIENSTHCYLCDMPFIDDAVKIRDHCHITGKYRGVCHNRCNLRAQNRSLPVLLHNLSGYDSHFIVKELSYDEKPIYVIPNSEEKYISFSKTINNRIHVTFLDTFRFMSASLETLVNNLPELREVSKYFDAEKTALLRRKGVFPYDYVTSWEVLEETKLPNKEDFYSTLTMCHIADDDYDHACRVWKSFECKNLGEYSDIYLKTDVLLLADVFESFRDLTSKTHKLDPCHYYTLPGLSWDAMLKFTKIKLELLSDYDMLMMIEDGIRGGICVASHRYVKANNQHIKNYNPEEESSYITYQDCNNLYGCAMMENLPISNFEWISSDNFQLEGLSTEHEFGYILDVDVDYPRHLHQLHNGLPFLAENIKIDGEKKLVPHLNDRKNYVVHYLALKQAIDNGLVLKKINRVIKFRQSKWLKPYIDHNTKYRAAANNDFEKDCYKMMSNSIYGKCLENLRHRMNMRLVSNVKSIEKLIAKPEFVDRTIYSETLAAVHMMKTSITFNRPIYAGMAILDISKTIMYQYHYDIMLKHYNPEKVKICYMDTDSYVYRINTENLYNDMANMLEYLDTSDYPKDHFCYSLKNKKIPGKFKDECNSKIILKFIALRAKMYAIQMDGKLVKKSKGIQRAVVRKCIDFEDYEQCLFTNSTLRMPMNQIISRKHEVSTVEINKIALSPHDNKRIILEDGITTNAIGFNPHN